MSSDCIEWWKGRDKNGYGRVAVNGKNRLAHRFVWEQCFGPIPDGMILRHYVCDNPPCVNPEHLRLGTQRDNIEDMVRKGRASRTPRTPKKDECHKGHPLVEGNLYYTERLGRVDRICKACSLERSRARRSSVD